MVEHIRVTLLDISHSEDWSHHLQARMKYTRDEPSYQTSKYTLIFLVDQGKTVLQRYIRIPCLGSLFVRNGEF